jgi:hypothetical protein
MTEQRSIGGPLKILGNAYLTLPIGTTAQRSTITSPTRGMIRYNSTTEKIEYYNIVRNEWDNFIDEDYLNAELAKKVSKVGDDMTGSLVMGSDITNQPAHIYPLVSDRNDLGRPSNRWDNIYGKTLYVDSILNSSGGTSVFEGNLDGNATTSTTWAAPITLAISGDGTAPAVSVDGSQNIILNLTNTVATKWRSPSTITIAGDADSVSHSFDGETNQSMSFNLNVNTATRWRNPVLIQGGGNIVFKSDPMDWNSADISVPLDGDEGTIILPMQIRSIPDEILRNHYVRKTGDKMTGPLTMENAGIYSEYNSDLILTGRRSVLLTAQFDGTVDIASNEGGINLSTSDVVTMNTNEVYMYGSGVLQMPAGQTFQRPDQSLWDIGMIRYNAHINRFEIWINSPYPDPDPAIGMPDSNNDYQTPLPGGQVTGWSALVSDADLMDNPLVKALIARMIRDIIYNAIGSFDLYMEAGHTPGAPPSWLNSFQNHRGNNWFSHLNTGMGINYAVFAGNYETQNNTSNANTVGFHSGNATSEPLKTHVTTHFTFHINVAEVAGIPLAKRGDYNYNAVSSLFKVSELNFWDYGGGGVQWRYAVDMAPVDNVGTFRVSIELFAFKSYHAAEIGARWFTTMNKFQNYGS